MSGFNPRPALRPGEALARFLNTNDPTCFNPRPALRPGEAMAVKKIKLSRGVSIRARP